jgi:hypothetical protein
METTEVKDRLRYYSNRIDAVPNDSVFITTGVDGQQVQDWEDNTQEEDAEARFQKQTT